MELQSLVVKLTIFVCLSGKRINGNVPIVLGAVVAYLESYNACPAVVQEASSACFDTLLSTLNEWPKV